MWMDAEPSVSSPDVNDFDRFVREDAPRLRQLLVARFGVEIGTETYADVLEWAWEHRDRMAGIVNPVGYLYRAGQSKSRRYRRWRRRMPDLMVMQVEVEAGEVREDVLRALGRLSPNQRVAVLMVHAYDATYAEVAAALGISVVAVTNHVHRGMRRLRSHLEGDQ